MRFDCQAQIEAGSAHVRIGHRVRRPGAVFKWSDWSDLALPFHDDLTLYNMEPLVMHDWLIQDDIGGGMGTGEVLPFLPQDLVDLSGEMTAEGTSPQSTYIVFDYRRTDFDEFYLVAYDTDGGFISWYQEIPGYLGSSETGRLDGWSLTPNGGSLLAIVDHRLMYEWDWAGAELHLRSFSDCYGGASDTGPCPHHDIQRTAAGETWVVMTEVVSSPSILGSNWDICRDGEVLGEFLDDGLKQLDTNFSVISTHSLFANMGYDPTVDPGPYYVDPLTSVTECQGHANGWHDIAFGDGYEIDTTHVNSVFVQSLGNGANHVWISAPGYNEIIRYRPSDQKKLWTLSGEDAALGRGDFDIDTDGAIDDSGAYLDELFVNREDEFGFQHDVHFVNGHLQFFDNRHGKAGPPRVVQLELAPAIPPARGTATIIKSWVPMDLPENPCWVKGAARTVPGSAGGNTVLMLCDTAIIEHSQPTGVPADHDYMLTVPRLLGSSGLFRAYPMKDLGEF